MSMDLNRLVTESRLTESLNIDEVSTAEMVRIINQQDRHVAEAVEREIPRIAQAIDLIADRMRKGGRLFYVGAGTSGRLGVLDASEIPPTYGTPLDLVQGLIAGGWRAIFETQEGAEDSAEDGTREIASRATPQDAVVGIAASGRTPYTIAAVEEAKRMGCATVAVTNNPDSRLAQVADVAIAAVVGPEVIMGSTRMKAGTAQKMVLNMLTTGVMIKLGKVYSNLMVDMQASNAKLRQRAINMVTIATGVDAAAAEAMLGRCNGSTKQAIVALLAGVEPAAAQTALEQSGGLARQAIELARGAGR